MDTSRLSRWTGTISAVGGLVWVVGNVRHALKPRGCVADECLTMPMRGSSTLDGVLQVGSMLLLLVALTGLTVLMRRAQRFGAAARAGVSLGVAGLVLLLTAGMVQAVFFGGDFRLMPYFVIPGLLAVVSGFVLVGVAVLRAGVLPRWCGVLLVLGALGMLLGNEQTSGVLLFIPFGVAWLAVGYVLWSGVGPAAAQTEAPPG
jgi:hypothetical protein